MIVFYKAIPNSPTTTLKDGMSASATTINLNGMVFSEAPGLATIGCDGDDPETILFTGLDPLTNRITGIKRSIDTATISGTTYGSAREWPAGTKIARVYTAIDINTIITWIENRRRIEINPLDFGGVGDGVSRPLSEGYSTLAAAQVDYPHALSLNDELDWAAIQKCLNYNQARGIEVMIPIGEWLTNRGLVANRDLVKIKGVGFGFWDKFGMVTNPGYGIEGIGYSKIKATQAGFNIISVTADTTGDPLVDRRNGIVIEGLYLYGYNKTGWGIYFDLHHDQPFVEKNFIHNTEHGIHAFADTPHINGNTVMDIAGDGILTVGPSAFLDGNCIADIGGDGMVIKSEYAQVGINSLVRCRRGIYLIKDTITGQNRIPDSSVINGAVFRDNRQSDIEAIDINDVAVSDITVRKNHANYAAIKLTNCDRWSICGGTLRQTAGSGSAGAVEIDDNSTGGLIEGMVASGGWEANNHISAGYVKGTNVGI